MAFESGEQDGHDFAFMILGIILAVMMLGTFLESLGYTNFVNFIDGDSNTSSEDVESGEDLSWSESLLVSNLDLGDYIVNFKDTLIRPQPGAQPIGLQDKGEKGRIMEGPASRFDTTWWRVDYEESPDGWVSKDEITNKTGLYVGLNIIPITLSFLKPVAIILSVIILILIFVVFLKRAEFNRLSKKEAEVKKEQERMSLGHDTENEEENTQDESDKMDNSPIEGLPVGNLPIGQKPETEKPSNRRWSNIQTLINSYNMNDWKQAIIEADTILEEMLEKMGYKGDSIGDKLKQVEKSDFVTLNEAWEAHKVRNRIAHSGSNFTLSKDEAERVIGMYRKVFSEFFYI
jgi:hypothetical protein